MSNKTPTYRELKKFFTTVLGFKYKRTKGSHEAYEGYTKGIRSIITLDKNHDSFSSKIQKMNLKSMIKQAGLSKREFEKKFKDI